MKILVTGGSGLVGSQFKSDKYKRISSKDLNLLDQKSIKEYLELNKDVDSIIHCAARVGGVKANMEYPAEFTYENLKMNTGIIEEAKNAGIKNLVCF
jgi:GDP-L-fucose synthase